MNAADAGYRRNRFTYGLGTIGRDMVYTLISMFFLTYYLTDVVRLPDATLLQITVITLVCRVFDACNDPVMGIIVDNTHTRWGKFKLWIALGAVATAVLTVLLFCDFGLTGTPFILLFTLLYLLWGIGFTINDISYWSMLPTLSVRPKEREIIGSIARICANIGLFSVVAGIVPLTQALGNALGGLQRGYLALAVIVVIIMLAGQCITLLGVREPHVVVDRTQQHTGLRDMLRTIVKNDQLLFTAISMTLFMIGYMTTTGFGLYFFKYAYGDEGMYSVFSVVLAVSQIGALAAFPLLSRFFARKTLYTSSVAIILLGYAIFFFSPINTMLYIGIAGVLIFVGQACIQLLMLMFLADSVDYGQWKLRKRNDSVSFALQPFINKASGAIGTAVVNVVVVLSGIRDAQSAAEVSPGGLLMMKLAMLAFPPVCILISYLIYRAKYRIDANMHAQIIDELTARGDLAGEAQADSMTS